MWAWLLTVAGVLAAWIYAVFGVLVAPAPLVLLGVTVWLCVQRRRLELAILVGTSPIGVSLLFGIGSYLGGTAQLMTVGYPPVELANVGRMTRLQTASTGCMVSGGEWMTHLPNNAVLVALRFMFGPMPGAYDGPYPPDADVTETLSKAAPLATSDVELDRLHVSGRAIRLQPGIGKKLVNALESRGFLEAKAAIWRDRVLVLGFTFSGTADERGIDVLIDIDSGKILAYRGAGLDRGLPEQWTES